MLHFGISYCQVQNSNICIRWLTDCLHQNIKSQPSNIDFWTSLQASWIKVCPRSRYIQPAPWMSLQPSKIWESLAYRLLHGPGRPFTIWPLTFLILFLPVPSPHALNSLFLVSGIFFLQVFIYLAALKWEKRLSERVTFEQNFKGACRKQSGK